MRKELSKYGRIYAMSGFKIIAKDKSSRAGILTTAHGEVETPIFMPVGTQGTVKALGPDDLKNSQAQIILGNTYHLYLRPGNKLIKKMGGLHKFMGWDKPILTDSGGFQAFSLGAMIEHGVRKTMNAQGSARPNSLGVLSASSPIRPPHYVAGAQWGTPLAATPSQSKNRFASPLDTHTTEQRVPVGKIDDDGVHFVSHLDGSKHLLSPERSIEIQLDLGSDVCLVLDELLSPMHLPQYVKESLERTHRWELRSKEHFLSNLSNSSNPSSLLFGIVQGVQDEEIRKNEAKWVAKQGFDGVSIGGSFGVSSVWGGSPSTHSDFVETDWANLSAVTQAMEWIVPNLPEDWAKHALGIGEVADIFECVGRGIDMFDCVAPTRRARNGSLYITPKNGGRVSNHFTLTISRTEFKEDKKAIDPGCSCYTCQNFSRSYLRHLYLANELLYHRLASIHNVYFMINLTRIIRESIIDQQFSKLKKVWL